MVVQSTEYRVQSTDNRWQMTEYRWQMTKREQNKFIYYVEPTQERTQNHPTQEWAQNQTCLNYAERQGGRQDVNSEQSQDDIVGLKEKGEIKKTRQDTLWESDIWEQDIARVQIPNSQ